METSAVYSSLLSRHYTLDNMWLAKSGNIKTLNFGDVLILK
jgi:hypothetical protein